MRKSQIQEIKALYSSKQRIINPAVILPDNVSDKKKQAFFNSVMNKLNINNTSEKI